MPGTHHQTATSTPLPTPTPLPNFVPLPALHRMRSVDDPSTARRGDQELVYVPGSAADRIARVNKMSSPLRRGAHQSWWTADQGWFNAVSSTIPTYRVLNEEGRPVKGGTVPEVDKEEALKMYKAMALIPVVDNVLYQSQRQGRISFYMQCSGEEAAVVGSAAAMQPTDEVFGQYVSVICAIGKAVSGAHSS